MLYCHKQAIGILAILLTFSLAPRAAQAQDCDPAWHPIVSGGQTGVGLPTYSLTVWNGDLIAGGEFTSAGGQSVNHIARWDGSAWHPFVSGGQIGVGDVPSVDRV